MNKAKKIIKYVEKEMQRTQCKRVNIAVGKLDKKTVEKINQYMICRPSLFGYYFFEKH